MSIDGIKAIVFDLDGTLIASSIDFRIMRDRIISFLRSHGIPEEMLDANDTVTNNLGRFRSFMKVRGQASTLEEMEPAIDSLLIEVELENVERSSQLKGAEEALEIIKEDGFLIGLLTRGSRTYTMKALMSSGLDHRHFDVIVCRDDFPASDAKPNSRAMENVANSLGLSPRECLMLGDHPIDMLCARNAGSTFVGVLSGWSDDSTWKEKGCGNVIDSVASLPAWLLERKLKS
jgi:HAD superfamily hydrolase (TIGR01549 family)